jgi:hypothetical protein
VRYVTTALLVRLILALLLVLPLLTACGGKSY